jgi:hypothetical protein
MLHTRSLDVDKVLKWLLKEKTSSGSGKLLQILASTVILGSKSRVFFFNLCGGTLGTAATLGLLYQPRMIGDGDCGEIGRRRLAGETEVL